MAIEGQAVVTVDELDYYQRHLMTMRDVRTGESEVRLSADDGVVLMPGTRGGSRPTDGVGSSWYVLCAGGLVISIWSACISSCRRPVAVCLRHVPVHHVVWFGPCATGVRVPGRGA